jgi:hypothetical protein
VYCTFSAFSVAFDSSRLRTVGRWRLIYAHRIGLAKAQAQGRPHDATPRCNGLRHTLDAAIRCERVDHRSAWAVALCDLHFQRLLVGNSSDINSRTQQEQLESGTSQAEILYIWARGSAGQESSGKTSVA